MSEIKDTIMKPHMQAKKNEKVIIERLGFYIFPQEKKFISLGILINGSKL